MDERLPGRSRPRCRTKCRRDKTEQDGLDGQNHEGRGGTAQDCAMHHERTVPGKTGQNDGWGRHDDTRQRIYVTSDGWSMNLLVDAFFSTKSASTVLVDALFVEKSASTFLVGALFAKYCCLSWHMKQIPMSFCCFFCYMKQIQLPFCSL